MPAWLVVVDFLTLCALDLAPFWIRVMSKPRHERGAALRSASVQSLLVALLLLGFATNSDAFFVRLVAFAADNPQVCSLVCVAAIVILTLWLYSEVVVLSKARRTSVEL